MARTPGRHPLGKCGETRFEISLPEELRRRLHHIAGLNGMADTTWARDVLEKAIEGEWAFIQRRVVARQRAEQDQKPPEEFPDA